MPPVIPACLIERKREGGTLAPDEIDAFFRGYLQGEVTDYQMSAFLMAVFLRGLGPAELDALVGRMVESGATLDLSRLSGPKVDKHSTGGVGDKVSLVLAPLAAELEMRVPMMAGRGLGQTRRDPRQARGHPGVSHRSLPGPPGRSHRGGGLRRDRVDGRDRAPRPPSLRASQCHRDGAGPASDRFEHHEQEACGRARCPGTGREGGGGGGGGGAFLSPEERSLELAGTMVSLGEARGLRTVALLTAMDRPLGRAGQQRA